MKKLLIHTLLLLAAACTSFEKSPYGDSLRTLDARVVYPEDHAGYLRAGVEVKLRDRNTSNVYTAHTDALGAVRFRVAAGHYRLSVLDRPDAEAVFNGTVEQVDLAAHDAGVEVPLRYSKPGTIIIKEIYTGGCPQDPPATGAYVYDKYVVLHNNSFETQYLDSLCLDMVAPYNSTAQNNPWTSTDDAGNLVFRKYAAVPDCIWQFGGTGRDFPLEPGADVVVAMNGAVDHSKTYSQSVNLNREGYFVLYDELLFSDERSHPTPGDLIEPSRHLKVLKKTAKNHVYTISNNSPAVILFRAEPKVDLQAYLDDDAQSAVVNGSITYTKIPWEWIVDGVEVSNKTGAVSNKRLRTDVDAGAVDFSAKPQGHTLHRMLDEEATQSAGFDIYFDTNNSSHDFYERETQSLRNGL